MLVDLPGFQRPRDPLTERMQRTVDESFEDVDGVLFVLAADETIGGGDRFIAARVYGGGAPVVVALNKVDRVPPERVVAQIAARCRTGRLPGAASRQRAPAGRASTSSARRSSASCPRGPPTSPRAR